MPSPEQADELEDVQPAETHSLHCLTRKEYQGERQANPSDNPPDFPAAVVDAVEGHMLGHGTGSRNGTQEKDSQPSPSRPDAFDHSLAGMSQRSRCM